MQTMSPAVREQAAKVSQRIERTLDSGNEVISTTLGGAVAGMAIAGPVGLAIGAGVGLILGAAVAKKRSNGS